MAGRMTDAEIDLFAQWLRNPGVPDAEKNRQCERMLADAQQGLEVHGKAACHLAYRIIDGGFAANRVWWVLDRLRGIELEAEICPTGWLGSRWKVSARMAEMYLRLLIVDHHAMGWALADVIRSSAVDVTVHPACAVNACRAAVLIATHATVTGRDELAKCHIEECRKHFLGSIRSIHRWKPLMILAEEVGMMARMLRACEILETAPADLTWRDQLKAVEPARPFQDALILALQDDQSTHR